MARQPFFSGNYGSALGQIDTRPIMQGAAAQAAMYQGLGQNIGGAIEKYQLNKQKREKNEAAAIGTISGMPPQMLQALSANPETAKLLERIQGENASPKDFDKFNAMSAAYKVQQNAALEQENARAKAEALRSQNVITDLQGEFNRRTQDDRTYAVHNETYATTLANQGEELRQKLLKAKNKREEEEVEREIELHDLKVEGAKGANLEGSNRRKLFEDTYEDTIKKTKADRQIAEEDVKLKAATTAYTEANERLKDAEAATAERAAKDEAWRLGDTRKIKGNTYVKTGPGSIKPIFDGLLTQADRDKITADAFGGERLLTYHNNTRDDKGTPNPDLFTSQEFDPNMERLLILANMGTLDDLKNISEGGPELESKVRDLLGDYLPQEEATGGTTDRVALARQALQDPNATPQVKEQAKKILQMAGQ